MKKNLLVILPIILVIVSCSVKNLCVDYSSDSETFRASAMANSQNPNMAEERALLVAKQRIATEIDDYITENYQVQTIIEDEEFSSRILTARKTVLRNVRIVCNQRTTRRGVVYAHTAIEVDKTDVDDHVRRVLTIEIE